MVRLVFLLRRKPELSLEKFQQYWREEHAPLVVRHARALGVQRYVQVHTLDDPLNAQLAEARGGMEPPYDGVAELWWDSEEAIAGSDPSAGAELLADEQTFIDLARSPLYLTHEYPQINPAPENIVARERSSIVKLYFPLRTHAGRDEDDAQLYWRTTHGPLIRSFAGANGLLRYMQVHRYRSPLEPAFRESRGTQTEPYLGHAEAWFDRGAPRSSPEAALSGRRAIEDESRFIDFKRSSIWIAKERVILDRLG